MRVADYERLPKMFDPPEQLEIDPDLIEELFPGSDRAFEETHDR
ncbi:hypothetical protein [Brevibacterium album]|nr:hypothetical protein [Brevibacterium album]